MFTYIDTRENSSQHGNFIYYKSDGETGFTFPDEPLGVVFTQSSEVMKECKERGISVLTLSSQLGVVDNMGLYEIFSLFFDGKVSSDFDMIEAIFNGFIKDSPYCYCLKIGVSFCWFVIQDKVLKKLGTLQFSESISKFTVGKFFKRLRYTIVKSGVSLNKVRFLTWSDNDISYEFARYIMSYDCLETFFSKIQGLSGFSLDNVYNLLSRNVNNRRSVTAENMVDCLADNMTILGIEVIDGILYSKNVYYKDYSSCISPVINSYECEYGIILDCEGITSNDGSLSNGCRELGGIIYCKYRNILLNLNMFSCDRLLLEETLSQVFENYRGIIECNPKTINVVTFGSSDIVMLRSSIEKDCSNKFRKNIFSKFKFIDCRDFIMQNLDKKLEDKYTLVNIARSLDVLPVFPKHKPLNDARTLFNILASILNTKNIFCC